MPKPLHYLYPILFLVLFALQTYTLWIVLRFSSTQAAVQSPQAQAAQAQQGTGTFTIGSAQASFSGTVQNVNPGALTIKLLGGGTQITLLTSSTQYVKQGVMKDTATQESDLAAYNAQIKTLMADPVKNESALEHMNLPLPYETTMVSPSAVTVGSSVVVIANNNGSSTYQAITVILL